MTITEQLLAAFEKSGWSVQELLDRCKLPIDRSSLHRKLTGDLPMKVTEAQAIALALDHKIVWPSKRRRAA